MIQKDLSKPFSVEGFFWLPPTPDDNIHGVLTFNPGESLTLRLDEPFDLKFSNVHAYPTIVGRTLGGPFVTLMDTFESSRSSGSAGSGFVDIHVNRALVGAGVPNPDAFRSNTASINFTYLQQFFSLGEVTTVINETETVATFRAAPSIQINAAAASITIRADFHWTTSQTLSSMTWDKHTRLNLVSDQPKLLEEWLSVVSHLQNLHSLLIGQEVGLLELSLLVPEGGDVQTDIVGEASFIALQSAKPSTEMLHPLKMLLPFLRLGASYNTVISRWLGMSEKFAFVMPVFFDAWNGKHSVLETRFLAIMSALEAFHRIRDGGTYMTTDEYALVFESIARLLPASITGDHRTSLKNRLKFGNEFSQRKRLTLLLAALPPNLRDLVVGGSQDLVARAVATRNLYTHLGPDTGAPPYKGRQIFYVTERLNILMRILLLSEAGVEADMLLSAITGHSRTNWALSRPLD